MLKTPNSLEKNPGVNPFLLTLSLKALTPVQMDRTPGYLTPTLVQNESVPELKARTSGKGTMTQVKNTPEPKQNKPTPDCRNPKQQHMELTVFFLKNRLDEKALSLLKTKKEVSGTSLCAPRRRRSLRFSKGTVASRASATGIRAQNNSKAHPEALEGALKNSTHPIAEKGIE